MTEFWTTVDPGGDSTTITTDNLPPLTERLTEASILVIIATVALIGNIGLWIVVLSNKRLRTRSNVFILALSGADILVSGTNMPITVYTLISGTWQLSQTACVASGFITMITFIASVMFLAVISINRYLLICKPHWFNALSTRRNVIIIVVGKEYSR